ncbi:putative membrane protein [Pseudomonas reidholzensis]|uniref:Putative membrane protein n=1 Tax=Pseudomonas reidholzensis TaxID=1785162 RepID=A0A383RNK3_9PSED|nr:prepilin-type N-terminal cleavage/methylation domain-containing protein [Pseudomonas reidholzensis]SYX88637.1 putative membrane protein [Pseudomonas reidholzensis]
MRTKARGMTLLEVILGLAVLALGVLAAAVLQVRALQATDSARRDSQATHLAQGLLERARAAGGLQSGELLQWQRQVREVLGDQAQGRVSRAGARLVVQIDWPDARAPAPPGIRLQGRP